MGETSVPVMGAMTIGARADEPTVGETSVPVMGAMTISARADEVKG